MTGKDKDLHAQAKERFEELQGYWNEYYSEAQGRIDFLLNKDNAQWDDQRTYEPDKLKLCINKCPSEVDAIVNEMRASRPSINTDPVEGSDVDASEVLDGLVRNTQKVSNADSAYDVAAMYQVAGGIGWIKVGLDWVPGTFNQEPTIGTVDDFASVYIDNLSTALDGSDMRDAFIVNDEVPIKEFEREYPNAAKVDFQSCKGWATEKTVRLAEYYYIEKETETLYQVDLAGQITVMRQKDVEAYNQELASALGPLNILQEREEEVNKVKWCKLNGQEILEETDWLGEHIPIVPVYGKMVFNRGKRYIQSLIDVLKDPQRLLNYWESFNTETGALQPKAQWTATAEQLEGYEDMWQDANKKNYPFLLYNSHEVNGMFVPPPNRQPPPQLSPVLQSQSQIALQHIKGVTGKVYDEGQKTLGSESGKAILAKDRRADVASFHYMDNQSKSIRQVGKILIDLYPKIYSVGQIKRILGEDGEAESILLDEQFFKGRYDVTVSVGPSYSSRRQEFVESMAQLPESITQVCGDIILRNMDFPGAREAADRIKKTLPPNLTDDEQTPEQAALQQATQAIEMLKGRLGEMQKALDDKSRSEEMKHQVDMLNVDIKNKEIEIKAFEASIEAMKAKAESEGQIKPQDFAQIIQFITGLDDRVSDIYGAMELLLEADEGPPEPGNAGNEPPPGGFFNGESSPPQ